MNAFKRLMINKRLNITALMTTVSTVCGYYCYQKHDKQHKHTFAANNRQLIPNVGLRIGRMSDKHNNYTTDDIVEHFIKRFVAIYKSKGYNADNSTAFEWGSGIVIDNHYILTNCHASDGAGGVDVYPMGWDWEGDLGIKYPAKKGRLVYAEPDLDSALIRLIPDQLDVESGVQFATGVEAGEPLVIIGNPPLIDFSPAVGVVRNVDRSAQSLSIGTYQVAHNYPSADSRHLIHDCPQYDGYSGGPVINTAKEVVGLIWGSISDFRENCAIPSQSVTAFISRGLKFELKDSEDRRTYRASKSLGLVMKSVSDMKTVQRRVYGTFDPTINAPLVVNKSLLNINCRTEHTFKKSDIIVAVNEMAVNSVSELRDCLQKCPTGEVVDITVIRSLDPTNRTHIYVKPEPIVCSVI